MLCLSAGAFFQINGAQAARLYAAAAEAATGPRVLELYAGAGGIALTIAPHAREVIAVEEHPGAAADAAASIARAGRSNVRAVTADAEAEAGRLADAGERFDAVVLDPPRKGASVPTLAAIARLAPTRIGYVSCNPTTLARDAELLGRAGYTPAAVRAFDLFPHTPHIETLTTPRAPDPTPASAPANAGPARARA